MNVNTDDPVPVLSVALSSVIVLVTLAPSKFQGKGLLGQEGIMTIAP